MTSLQQKGGVLLIVQARMGSSRLPGKVMKPLLGEPMLKILLQRLSRVPEINQIIVATTTEPPDRVIVDACAEWGYRTFRGSETDVLDRFYQAAQSLSPDVVIRITSDCPLIEPTLISEMIREFRKETSVDYLTNTLPPRTFPRGLDTEIFTFAALERAWKEASGEGFREHVTPYFYKNPKKFICKGFFSQKDYSRFRWTVDTSEDYELIKRIYDALGRFDFGWLEVIDLLKKHPEWSELNANIQQKNVV